LTIAAQEPAYSLRQGMARAFVLPDGTPLQAAIKAPSAQAGTLFERRMRSAIINGQTSQDLARQLLDEAATPVRYLTNEARTGAQSAANAVNYDRLWETVGLERAMFVATLDSSTTPLCRSLSGRVYRLEDAPRPPLHRGCRSVLLPVWGGVMPTEGLNTPVDWLRAQPADVQDRVLGEAGGNAFRETGSLVDPARRGRR